MCDTGKKHGEFGGRAPIVLDQMEIDVMNMKELNQANRLYRKCLAGKCPPVLDKRTKISVSRKPKNLLSMKIHEQRLGFIWTEIGRAHRFKFMKTEIDDLDKKIRVATGKTHRTAQEKNFQGIEKALRDIEDFELKTNKAKMEIAHIKSQIERVAQKKIELSHETESEDQFQAHFKKANRQLDIFEGRVQNSRQRECLLTTENRKLRELMQNMLCDRAVFNYYWRKIVNNLRDRRKFLLDMIERSNQAFNQGAEFLDNLKKLNFRRLADTEFQMSEMVNMDRKIDANHIMNMFLGGKGKKRVMAPLEPREIRRRENFKIEYTNRLNLYNGLIENIKRFTGVPDISKATDHYLRQENDGFQIYKYLNELNQQTEYMTSSFLKLSTDISASNDYNRQKLKYFDQRIEDLHKTLHAEISKTLEMKDDRDKYENTIAVYLDGVTEIIKILDGDMTRLNKLLSDHTKVTVFNIPEFLSFLECRLNEILAYVYCDQRKNVADITVDDAKLAVKSLKRTHDERIEIEDVITTQQCAECAEGEDVNRYDDKTVYQLNHDAIQKIMQESISAPGMEQRLHNLSKCNLPRSGVIMGRRYAE